MELTAVCLFILSQWVDDITLAKYTVRVWKRFYGIFYYCEDIYGRYCIRKRNNDHFLSLFAMIFLFSRMNKLDRDFLNWQLLAFVCPLRNYLTLLLSYQSLSYVQTDATTPNNVASVCTGLKVITSF